MVETWKQNEIFDNYEVSNKGRVRNKKTGRILKPSIDSRGYETLKISKDGKRVTMRVGKLVADTYISKDPQKPNIKYIDGNKHNNIPDNLMRVSRGKEIQVVETNKVYRSITECSKNIGISRSTISKCCNYPFYNNSKGLHFRIT